MLEKRYESINGSDYDNEFQDLDDDSEEEEQLGSSSKGKKSKGKKSKEKKAKKKTSSAQKSDDSTAQSFVQTAGKDPLQTKLAVKAKKKVAEEKKQDSDVELTEAKGSSKRKRSSESEDQDHQTSDDDSGSGSGSGSGSSNSNSDSDGTSSDESENDSDSDVSIDTLADSREAMQFTERWERARRVARSWSSDGSVRGDRGECERKELAQCGSSRDDALFVRHPRYSFAIAPRSKLTQGWLNTYVIEWNKCERRRIMSLLTEHEHLLSAQEQEIKPKVGSESLRNHYIVLQNPNTLLTFVILLSEAKEAGGGTCRGLLSQR